MISADVFNSQLSYAQTMKNMEPDKQYWTGYMRGLRRGYYCDNFGTKAEHLSYMAAFNSIDPDRKQLGTGYRDGIRFCRRPGHPVVTDSARLHAVYVPIDLHEKMKIAAKKLKIDMPSFRRQCYEQFTDRVLKI